MILFELAAGDEHVAGQSRLRRQQIVVARVEPMLGGIEADGEEPSRRIVKKSEVDVGQRPGGVRELPEFVAPLAGVKRGGLERCMQQSQPARAGWGIGRMVGVVGLRHLLHQGQHCLGQVDDLPQGGAAVEMVEHHAEPGRPWVRLRSDPLPEMLGRRWQRRPWCEMMEVGELVGGGVDHGLRPPAALGVGGGGEITAGRRAGRNQARQRRRGTSHRDRLPQEFVGNPGPAGSTITLTTVAGR